MNIPVMAAKDRETIIKEAPTQTSRRSTFILNLHEPSVEELIGRAGPWICIALVDDHIDSWVRLKAGNADEFIDAASRYMTPVAPWGGLERFHPSVLMKDS
jgi:hypothetical protein